MSIPSRAAASPIPTSAISAASTVEHFWIGPELETMLGSMTPRYFSDGRAPILPKGAA